MIQFLFAHVSWITRYHIQRLGIHVEMVSDSTQGLSTINNMNQVTNMVLIEQEGMSSHFVNNTSWT